jgi:hypothetical protein
MSQIARNPTDAVDGFFTFTWLMICFIAVMVPAVFLINMLGVRSRLCAAREHRRVKVSNVLHHWIAPTCVTGR